MKEKILEAIDKKFEVLITPGGFAINKIFSSKKPSHNYTHYHYCQGEVKAYYLSSIDTWEIELSLPGCSPQGGDWWIRQAIGGFKADKLFYKPFAEGLFFKTIEEMVSFFFDFDHNGCGDRGKAAFCGVIKFIGW
jgi:hypothetical protein